jgi:hypothetical protein
MANKKIEEDEVEDLAENEEFISPQDDLDFRVELNETQKTVSVTFSGFEDEESAEEYAEFLVNTLPLLLFETTKIQ